jgi:hypothetical protein
MAEIMWFPKCHRKDFLPARLVADEQRLRDWFDSLGDADRRRSYTLAEIRAAVHVPATRLRVVLYRLGWRQTYNPEFGLSTYSRPQRTPWPTDMQDAEQVIRRLCESETLPAWPAVPMCSYLQL